MTKYIVTGGTRLKGKVDLHGAKNAGFKAMIGALLGESPSEICGLGLISEIDFAKKTIASLGASAKTLNDSHCFEIDPTTLNKFEIPKEIGEKSRSSTMYAGPLLAKFKKAIVPVPGGDTSIAKRPIERHIEGLKALGVQVDFADNTYVLKAPEGLTGTNYKFLKNTHTGTETMILAAVKAKGITILENAAAEPEVDDLMTLLNAMGGRIERLNGRTIKIVGVDHLHGVQHIVMKDRIEAATFACMALASKGDVTVCGASPLVLNSFLVALNESGSKWEKTEEGIRFWHDVPLKATKITTAPYPGFMTDWQPLWTTLMTQAHGTSFIHETVMEKRFNFIPDLEKMGAKFELFNPEIQNPKETYNFNLADDITGNKHAVRVFGPVNLSGKQIEIHDIRHGATLLLAGLVAKGKTIIVDQNDQIKRGYEDLPKRLIKLGAQIEVLQ